jgi:hypothetical protein
MINKQNLNTMKNSNEYVVRVYESKPYGDYQFKNNIDFEKPLTNLKEALEYVKETMKEQRKWRSTTNKMWASIKGEKDTKSLIFKEETWCLHNLEL